MTNFGSGAAGESSRRRHTAFTRIDLIVTLASLAVLAAVIAPALAAGKGDSDRVGCFNNLRMIGRAVQSWAGDHDQRPPWWVLRSEGGTMPDSGTKPANAWFEWSYLSNELATPRTLVCPADRIAPTALDWPTFVSAAYRSSALSYSLGIHASPVVPRARLAFDRNILYYYTSAGSCSARASGFDSFTAPRVAWTNSPYSHGDFGNVLLYDGTVEFTSTPRLKELWSEPEGTMGGADHVMRAR